MGACSLELSGQILPGVLRRVCEALYLSDACVAVVVDAPEPPVECFRCQVTAQKGTRHVNAVSGTNVNEVVAMSDGMVELKA